MTEKRGSDRQPDHFARIQLEIAFDDLLARATNFRLEEGADIPRLAGEPLFCPARLPLTFDRR